MNLYEWYWREYRCRVEPWTHEWQRYAKKWWGVILIKAGLLIGAMLWLLLFPPWALPFWLKITILVAGVLSLTFYGWLLLHLGGFARKLKGG